MQGRGGLVVNHTVGFFALDIREALVAVLQGVGLAGLQVGIDLVAVPLPEAQDVTDALRVRLELRPHRLQFRAVRLPACQHLRTHASRHPCHMERGARGKTLVKTQPNDTRVFRPCPSNSGVLNPPNADLFQADSQPPLESYLWNAQPVGAGSDAMWE